MKPPDKNSTSCRLASLDGLRGLAIIMVVSVHTLGYVKVPLESYRVLSFILHIITVPTFYFVDGYLLGRKILVTRNYRYREYIRSSVSRLVIPWIVFSLAYLGLRYVSELYGLVSTRILVTEEHWKDILIKVYGSVYSSHLYFLLSLFIMRVFSPLIRKFIIERNFRTSVLSFVVYCVAYRLILPLIEPILRIEDGSGPILNALFGMQFYILGAIALLLMQRYEPKEMIMPSALATTIFLSIDILRYGYYTSFVTRLFFLITALLLFISIRRMPLILQTLGTSTMGIYILHQPIILYVVSHLVKRIVPNPLLDYFIVVSLGITASYAAYKMICSVPYGRVIIGDARHLRRGAVAET